MTKQVKYSDSLPEFIKYALDDGLTPEQAFAYLAEEFPEIPMPYLMSRYEEGLRIKMILEKDS